jgi:hypothetical protein
MPYYLVRHLAVPFAEVQCLVQLEDEYAAMYFNIVHGARIGKRFTTVNAGKPCVDFLLVARNVKPQGQMEEREIALFELTV